MAPVAANGPARAPHLDRAAGDLLPEIGAGIALDDEPAARHAPAQPVEAREIAREDEALGIALPHIENLGQRQAAIADPQRQALDLGRPEAGKARRGQPARLDGLRHRRLEGERQRAHPRSFRRWK